LVLVDTDWSLEEISNYNISPDERIAIENPVKIQSAEELASVIIKSQSTLTLFTSGTTGQPKKKAFSPKFIEKY
jgi:acyl-coenzyme A synthetase/AMP-(fatty) acid ligase